MERMGTARGTERLDVCQSDVDTFFNTNVASKHQTEEHCTMPLSLAMDEQKLHKHSAKLKKNLKSDHFLSAK